jgi:histone demethylase JARID1
MEKERLDQLPNHLKMLKMDNDFDSVEERECFSCLYDLHLSAVGCECFPDRYSCLRHFKLFCSCEMDRRFVLFRYTMNKLSTLVEALEGKPRAIEAWETQNNGGVSASAEDACMDEQAMEREMCKTKDCEEGKSPPSCPGTNERSSSPYSHISSELAMDNAVKEDKPDKPSLNVADGFKLFGVNLQMNSDSGQKLNSSVETGVLDTSNTSMSLANQSSPMQKFSISAELVSLGTVLYGNHWFSNQAIYPKGMLL